MNIIERAENLEDEVYNLKSEILKMKTAKLFPNGDNGQITTEDIVKAICKKLDINIYRIDMGPTIKE